MTTTAPAGATMDMIPLDLRGLKSPLPVLRVRKALIAARAGSLLVVQCTDGSTVLFEAHSCPKVALKGAIAQLVAGLSVIVI